MKQNQPPTPPGSLLNILDRLGIGYYRSSPQGKILFMNNAGAAIYGCTPEDFAEGTRSVQEFYVYGFDREVLSEQLRRFGYIGSYIAPGKRPNGETFYVNVTLKSLKGEGGEFIGCEGVFREVTLEVETVREQTALARRIKESNEGLVKLVSLQDEMMSSLSHDLVTPPVVIQGFTELLLKGRYGSLKPPQESAVKTIQRNAHYISGLVEGLLSFSRYTRAIQEGKAGSAGLAASWRAAVARIVDGDEDRKRFKIEAPEGDRQTKVREDLLAPLLGNLAWNALRLAPPGETISSRVHPGADGVVLEVAIEGFDNDDAIPLKVVEGFFPKPEILLERGETTPVALLGLSAARYAAHLLGGSLSSTGQEGGLHLLVLTLP